MIRIHTKIIASLTLCFSFLNLGCSHTVDPGKALLNEYLDSVAKDFLPLGLNEEKTVAAVVEMLNKYIMANRERFGAFKSITESEVLAALSAVPHFPASLRVNDREILAEIYQTKKLPKGSRLIARVPENCYEAVFLELGLENENGGIGVYNKKPRGIIVVRVLFRG
jgi:hypothetical protein